MNSNIEDEVIMEDKSNFRFLFRLLLENKIFILKITGIAFIIFTAFAFYIKKTWEGQFQIVINQNNASANIDSQLANIAGINLGTGDNELETEVEILKSPSVLMPVFEFSKSKETPGNKLRFSDWKKSLDIKLQKNTSVLNISYKNIDKEKIIPVLNKMSISYQQYSGKNKRRSSELANNFFKEQISLFKKKSANSLRDAQEFAIDQDLVFYNFGKETQNNIENNPNQFLGNNLLEAPNLLLPNIGIENARIEAANQIRKINLQLMKMKELNDPEELQYIGSTIPSLVAEGLPKALSDIESDLLIARSKYTDKDIMILNLIKKRNFTIDLLRNRTIKYLKVEKLNAEATMKASMRPKGVLLKYKELIREAARDEQTLVQLEDKFNLFKLDLANQEDPWELITKPTLLSYPISPNRSRIILIGLLTGFTLGSGISLLKDRFNGKIFDEKAIEDLINIPIILNLNIKNKNQSKEICQLFSKQFVGEKKLSKNIILKVPGLCDYSKTDYFFESMKEYLIDCQILDKNIGELEIKNNDNYYLLINFNEINEKKLLDFKEKIKLINIMFKGIILINKFS